MSTLRPEAGRAAHGSYCPTNGTAYLMVYQAVQAKDRLVHGKLHALGESCAIGSFWDINPRVSLYESFIDEVAAVNDSVPHYSGSQRKQYVTRWLKWKLAELGMPGFALSKCQPPKKR